MAVEEDDGWVRGVPGFAVEDVDVIDLGRLVLHNSVRHD